MKYSTFFSFSFIGSALWVGLLTMMGYYLGNVPWVKDNFEKAILIVILLSFVPAIIEYISHRRQAKRQL